MTAIATAPNLVDDGLHALRSSLLTAAHQEAAEEIRGAESDAAQAVARAQVSVAGLIEAARRDGAAAAAQTSSRDDARMQRDVRAIMLSAQRTVYDELRRRTVEAVRGLRDEPGYPGLLAALERRARELAGPAAVVTPAPDGGIVAAAPGRVVRISLDDLADWALQQLHEQPAAAWSA